MICYEFPPVGGGGGRVAARVAQGLARKGHEVRFLTSQVAGLPREETLDGVTIRRAAAGRRRPDRCTVPEMAAYVLLQWWPAIAEARRFRPDVIHVHFAVPSGPIAWLASRLTGTPYVVTAHLGDVPGGVPEQTDRLFKLVKPFTTLIWRRAAATTAVASHVGQLAEAAYAVRPDVILNGIDMSTDLVRAPAQDGAPLRLIWCGRIQEQKNLGAGLEALAAIRDLDWTLDIIGDGPLRGDAQERCRRLRLDHLVRFHHWMTAKEVETEMAAADVLYLPSLSEGLSLVTVEALRVGLAFVASRIPGVMDVVVEGENGLLCDPSSPAEFAAAVARLVENRLLLARFQANSAGRRLQFDEQTMVAGYERVLRMASKAGR
ncbi:glycosyltransferase family 4 protein [Bosea sp. LC85]|uniref:glycosyltransferase family 4 protein n=1 Tax=Bosea sp. LC85 TaxID=1502851 RepID=UPI001378283D|nr:glycosyltransferase family 4 protein [Bosea sp. LC85]